MAWLYAIPYERFLTAGHATRANLWTLALVAAWRVALMTRVLSVILRVSPVAAFMLVMFFADVLALIAVSVVPVPIFNVMGGIRLSESAGMIASAAFTVQILGVLSLLIWSLGALVALITMRPDWRILHAGEASGGCPHGRLPWLAASAALVVCALLPITQREQHLRWRAEKMLHAGDIAAALEFMSRYQQTQFPPHWDPPPRLGYPRETPDIGTVVTALHAVNASDWVREAFASKFEWHLQATLHPYQRHWNEIARFVSEGGPWQPDGAGHTAAGLQMLLALSHRLGTNDRASIEAIILALERREGSNEGDR